MKGEDSSVTQGFYMMKAHHEKMETKKTGSEPEKTKVGLKLL